MIEDIVPEYIKKIEPYPPGKPIEELERELGISGSIKLASNENPLGPSPKAMEALGRALHNLHRYPDGSAFYLRNAIAEKFRVPAAGIVLGNGSNEIIELVVRTFVQPGDEVIVPLPSFLVYALTVQAVGGKVVTVPLRGLDIDLEEMVRETSARTRVVFVTNPNNPTGSVLSKADFERFLKALPSDVILVVDEAYIEFVRDGVTFLGFDYTGGSKPVVVTRTFSKAYGLAGLRVGYGVMSPEIAGYLNRVRQPFNVGTLAQAAATGALADDDFLETTRSLVWRERAWLQEKVAALGLKVHSSHTNFFLFETPVNARRIYEAMLHQGVIVRAMNAYGLNHCLRVTVGLPEENRRFYRVLSHVLESMGCLPGSGWRTG